MMYYKLKVNKRKDIEIVGVASEVDFNDNKFIYATADELKLIDPKHLIIKDGTNINLDTSFLEK